MDQNRFLATVRQSLEAWPETLCPSARSQKSDLSDRSDRPDRSESEPSDPSDARLDRLIRELQAVGGTVHRVDSAAAARQRIVEILQQRGARRVVRGNTARLRSLDLDAELERAGCEVTVCDLRDGTSREELRQAAFAADAGITSVDGAVAETGTLALVARPGQGRSISLLPPVHVAVLDAADVVWELGALFEKTAEGGPPSALTLITGPSRTGDIELVLTVGVHGPGELHLVVIG